MHMVGNRYRLPALGLALAALAACDSATGAEPDSGPPVVTVDYAQVGVTARSMVGFLHGLKTDAPADSMIAPLRPALWRSSLQQVEPRANGFGARFVLLLSDLWGYPVTNWTPPYQDWAAWEAFVRDVARRTRGQPIIYDIWNEYNVADFWRGSNAQFYETFRRAERVLRDELGPGVLVAGPSRSHWSESALRDFLQAMRTQGVRVDILTWHEFPDDPQIPSVQSHLETARRSFLRSAGYASLGLKEMQVQEMGAIGPQYRPSSVLAGLFYLERGGADAAARTCWWEQCWDNSLTGLLTPSGEPRAAWWAYRAYAATLAGRVASESSDSRLVSFATRGSSTGPAQVVVAYFGLRANSPPLDVTLELANLRTLVPAGGTGQLRVTVSRLPSTGEQPLPALPVLADTVVAPGAAGETVLLPLPAFPVDEARVITIEPEVPDASRSRARG